MEGKESYNNYGRTETLTRDETKALAREVVEFVRPKSLRIWQAQEVFRYAIKEIENEVLKQSADKAADYDLIYDGLTTDRSGKQLFQVIKFTVNPLPRVVRGEVPTDLRCKYIKLVEKPRNLLVLKLTNAGVVQGFCR